MTRSLLVQFIWLENSLMVILFHSVSSFVFDEEVYFSQYLLSLSLSLCDTDGVYLSAPSLLLRVPTSSHRSDKGLPTKVGRLGKWEEIT